MSIATRRFRDPLRIRRAASSTLNSAREPIRADPDGLAEVLGWLRPSTRLSSEDEQLLGVETYQGARLLKLPPDEPVAGGDSVVDIDDNEWSVVGDPVLVRNPRTQEPEYWKAGVTSA